MLRFKKYRSGLRTSNVSTYQQLLFAWQAEMDGMPPAATKVVAGYLLNRLQDDIDRMAITCSRGPELRWTIEIPDARADEALPTPISAVRGLEEPSPPVVHVARTEATRTREEE